MRLAALVKVTQEARPFARAYVAIVEALLSEGVPEGDARYEARMTALLCMQDPDDEDVWDAQLPD